MIFKQNTVNMGGDDAALQWIVANYGPVVVTLWATDPFTSYKTGVYYEPDCPTDSSNHAVVSSSLLLVNFILSYTLLTGYRWLWN